MPSERDVPDGHTPLAAVGSEGDTAGMLTPGILSAGSCAEQEAETREAGSYPEMVAPGRPSLRPGLFPERPACMGSGKTWPKEQRILVWRPEKLASGIPFSSWLP